MGMSDCSTFAALNLMLGTLLSEIKSSIQKLPG
jgi:hypothetical protein